MSVSVSVEVTCIAGVHDFQNQLVGEVFRLLCRIWLGLSCTLETT